MARQLAICSNLSYLYHNCAALCKCDVAWSAMLCFNPTILCAVYFFCAFTVVVISTSSLEDSSILIIMMDCFISIVAFKMIRWGAQLY